MGSIFTIAIVVALLTCMAFLTTLIAGEQNAGKYIATNLNDINQKFTNNLNQLISTGKPHENVVYSPISMHTILALAYTGASGKTAKELSTALGLSSNKTLVSEQFGRLMKSRRTASMELQMANKLYFSKGLATKRSFRKNAREYFNAEVEKTLFTDKVRTAKRINKWVARKTNKQILGMVDPNSLDENTLAIMMNVVYFKAKWAKQFLPEEATCDGFYMTAWQMAPVMMMHQQNTFNYADLSHELGASVLQLPYADSELSMLLLLPNEVDGLAEMESRLRDIDLRKLPERMQEKEVDIHIPKFRIEFEHDMKEILQKLQISSLFKDEYGLDGIFGDLQPAAISEVRHKAVLGINEAGSEVSAHLLNGFDYILPLPHISHIPLFIADHPFMFAIISPQAVYFVGHIVQPPSICEIM